MLLDDLPSHQDPKRNRNFAVIRSHLMGGGYLDFTDIDDEGANPTFGILHIHEVGVSERGLAALTERGLTK